MIVFSASKRIGNASHIDSERYGAAGCMTWWCYTPPAAYLSRPEFGPEYQRGFYSGASPGNSRDLVFGGIDDTYGQPVVNPADGILRNRNGCLFSARDRSDATIFHLPHYIVFD